MTYAEREQARQQVKIKIEGFKIVKAGRPKRVVPLLFPLFSWLFEIFVVHLQKICNVLTIIAPIIDNHTNLNPFVLWEKLLFRYLRCSSWRWALRGQTISRWNVPWIWGSWAPGLISAKTIEKNVFSAKTFALLEFSFYLCSITCRGGRRNP